MLKIFDIRKLFKSQFIIMSLALIIGFSSIIPSVTKAEENTNSSSETKHLSKQELLNEGVDPEKVDKLIEKMENGQKLDSDKYTEQNGTITANEDNPVVKKEFEDGSFIENSIEDVTDNNTSLAQDNMFTTQSIDWVGGQGEYRTLLVSHTAPWGRQSFNVKVYFPLIGYSKILQAYNWEYLGTVRSVDYKGIYRASETASQDAVAIQKLVIETPKIGVNYLVKLEFRMRDGRYWSTYTSS